ncbi:MAG: response regulator transcription factor [Chloroflexi bacterium]|nr:response regulator transcription factor [Chloroflexota bacterium]
MKILFVDDDRELLELLSFIATGAGLCPRMAHDASSALAALREESPDLLVLDIRLNDRDGWTVLEEVRRSSDLPVIVLSALTSEDDVVRALESGADDYLRKPFTHRELLGRIHGLLRRRATETSPLPRRRVEDLRIGGLALDPLQHTATVDGHPVTLTAIEFRLLELLMRNAGRVVPHDELLARVWGYQDANASNVVRAAVYRLRRKLETASNDDPPSLRTIPGVGVMLRTSAAPVRDGELTPVAA